MLHVFCIRSIKRMREDTTAERICLPLSAFYSILPPQVSDCSVSDACRASCKIKCCDRFPPKGVRVVKSSYAYSIVLRKNAFVSELGDNNERVVTSTDRLNDIDTVNLVPPFVNFT